MRDNPKEISDFCQELEKHALRKAQLYDGAGSRLDIDEALRFAIEEIGEVAAALTRKRDKLARYECVDLAHCAMLIALALDRNNQAI